MNDLLSESFNDLSVPAEAVYDVQFGTDSEDELPICRLEDSFVQQDWDGQQQKQQQLHARDRMGAHPAASEQVVASSSTSLPSDDEVIGPTQLSDDDSEADSRPLIDEAAAAAVAAAAGSYIFESCIPATCIDLLPPESPLVLSQQPLLQKQQQQQQQQEELHARRGSPTQQQLYHRGSPLAQQQQEWIAGCHQHEHHHQQQQQEQQQLLLQPVVDADLLHPHVAHPSRSDLPRASTAAAAEGSACAHKQPQLPAAVNPVPAGAKGRLSLRPVRRDAQAAQQQQQLQHDQHGQQHWQQLQQPCLGLSAAHSAQQHQPAVQQHSLVFAPVGPAAKAQQAGTPQGAWWQHQQHPVCHASSMHQQQQALGQPEAPQARGHTPWPPPAAAPQQRPAWHQQQQQWAAGGLVRPAALGLKKGPTAAARAYRQQKPFKAPQRSTAAAAAGAGAGAAGGAHQHSVQVAPAAAAAATAGAGSGGARPVVEGASILSRPPGSFKQPCRQQQSAAPAAAHTGAEAEAPAADGFVTGRGGGIAVSAAAKARAAALLQAELGAADAGGGGDNAAAGVEAVAHAGFTTGWGGSIAVSAAAKAHAAHLLQEELGPELMQPGDVKGVLQQQQQGGVLPPDEAAGWTAAPSSAAAAGVGSAAAGGGFVTGRGGGIAVSAEAQARAQRLLQEELGPAEAASPPETAPGAGAGGGFVTERGGSISVSVAAAARAAALLQEELGGDPEGQQHTAAAADAPARASAAAGFVTGRGSTISVSAAAQARATALLQEELGEAEAAAGVPDATGSAALQRHAVAQQLNPPLPPAASAAGQHPGAPPVGVASKGGFKAPRHVQALQATAAASAGAAAGPEGLSDSPLLPAWRLPQCQQVRLSEAPAGSGLVLPGPPAPAADGFDSPAGRQAVDMSVASDELASIDRLVREAEQQRGVAGGTDPPAAGLAASAGDEGPAVQATSCAAGHCLQQQQPFVQHCAAQQQQQQQQGSWWPCANAAVDAQPGQQQQQGAQLPWCQQPPPPQQQQQAQRSPVVLLPAETPAHDDTVPVAPSSQGCLPRGSGQQPGVRQHSSPSAAVPVAGDSSAGAAGFGAAADQQPQQQLDVEELVIADSQPESPAGSPPRSAARLPQPAAAAVAGAGCSQPRHTHQQAAVGAVGAGGLLPAPGPVAAAATSPAAAASGYVPTEQAVPKPAALAPQAPYVAAQRPGGSCQSQPAPRSTRSSPATHTPAAAARDGSSQPNAAVSTIQWASGAGVLLAQASLDEGALFVGRLVNLGLLQPAWRDKAVLADLAVTSEGRVQLLVEVLPPQPPQQQKQVPGSGGLGVSAGRCQSLGAATQPQHGSISSLFASSSGARAAARPPPPAAAGLGGRRNSAGGGGSSSASKGPKKGSLQALWSAAPAACAAGERTPSSKQQGAAGVAGSRSGGKASGGGRGLSQKQFRVRSRRDVADLQLLWGVAASAAEAAAAAAAAAAPEKAGSSKRCSPEPGTAMHAGADAQKQAHASSQLPWRSVSPPATGGAAGGSQLGSQQPLVVDLTAADSPASKAGASPTPHTQFDAVGAAAGEKGPAGNGRASQEQAAAGIAADNRAASPFAAQQLSGSKRASPEVHPAGGQHTGGSSSKRHSPGPQQQQEATVREQQQHQQQLQQQQQEMVQPAEADAVHCSSVVHAAAVAAGGGSSGLVTAGGKRVDTSAAAVQEFQRRMGYQAPGQQQQQQLQRQSEQAPPQQQCAVPGGLSTAGGRAVEASAAARAQFERMMGVKPQQQQHHHHHQQQQPAAGGLMTAGGASVQVSAEARQQLQQMLNLPAAQQQPPVQQSTGLSTAGGRGVQVSAGAMQQMQRLMGMPGPNQQPQHGTPSAGQATPDKRDLAGSTAGAAAAPAPATPGLAGRTQTHTAGTPSAAAAAAPTPAARPSPAAGGSSVTKTPGLPPRLSSRKRSLSHPHTPGLQQQASTAAAAGDASSKGVRKAFRAPAMASPAAHSRPAAGAAAQQHQDGNNSSISSGGGGSSAKKQRVQAPVSRGLPLQEYFAVARPQRQQVAQQVTNAAAAAGSGSTLAWVADSLPTNPKAAAAFAFRAAAVQHANAAPGASKPDQQDAAAAAGQGRTAAAAPPPPAPGGVFGPAEARTSLLAWGADPDKALPAWVCNHWKWVVWKLAAYDRKLMGAGDSSSSSSSGAWCLSAEGVLQQLQGRYTREVKEGERSVLKKILEQDLPAGVPIVLVVSDIRMRGATGATAANTNNTSSKPGQQQQQPASRPTAAAADAEVLGMQLSDGWYYVNTIIDGPITDLILNGRLQVGAKVRVVGAELRSDRAAEPLDAARTALLRVSYNSISPAPWDAKLGPVPAGETLRALSQVHPAGGLVPRLLLLVTRRYPLQYWCRTTKQMLTPKLLATAQQRAERQQEQAAHAAQAAAMHEELQQCKQWAADKGGSSSSTLERAYAAAVLAADGGGGSEGGVGVAELQAFRAGRQNHLETRKQWFLQQELQKSAAAAAAAAAAGAEPKWQQLSRSSSGGGGTGSAAAVAAGIVDLSEQPVPFMVLRVAGVVPQGCGSSWGFGAASVKVWRPCEAVQQLDEGAVVLATGLSAGSSGRHSSSSSRVLELNSGKMTSWQLLGPAASLASSLDMPPWQPRATVQLSQLSRPRDIGAEVDFTGALVWAGDVNTDGRDWTQWIFMTDDSAAAAGANAPATAGANAAPKAAAADPAHQLLAVCLAGAPTSIDWLTPSTQPAAAAGGGGRSSSKAGMRTEPRLQATFVAASNLVLQSYDAARGIWVAEAQSNASVAVVSGSDVRVRQLAAWARGDGAAVLKACRVRVQQVLGA